VRPYARLAPGLHRLPQVMADRFALQVPAANCRAVWGAAPAEFRTGQVGCARFRFLLGQFRHENTIVLGCTWIPVPGWMVLLSADRRSHRRGARVRMDLPRSRATRTVAALSHVLMSWIIPWRLCAQDPTPGVNLSTSGHELFRASAVYCGDRMPEKYGAARQSVNHIAELENRRASGFCSVASGEVAITSSKTEGYLGPYDVS
jgi:hypothetical protein